jgi:hypothetical protein
MDTIVNNTPTFRHINVSYKDVDGTLMIRPIKLAPGANALNKEDSEAFKAAIDLPVVQNLFVKKLLEYKDTPEGKDKYVPGQLVRDLSALTELDALTAIQDCKSTKTLITWGHQDPRSAVRKALDTRHKELQPKRAESE